MSINYVFDVRVDDIKHLRATLEDLHEQAVRLELKRLEEEAAVWYAAGYTADELVIVEFTPCHHRKVLPKVQINTGGLTCGCIAKSVT